MPRLRQIIFSACCLLTGCGYDSFEPLPPPTLDLPLPNCTIASVAAFYADRPCLINDNAIFDGYVTSSDRSGNFYRSFMLEDSSGAIEVAAGVSDLHNIYPVGQRVVIVADNLGLSSYNGVLQIGAGIDSWSLRVRSFASRVTLDRAIRRDTVNRPLPPAEVTIDRLTPRMCGRLVRIEALCIPPDTSLTWATGRRPNAAPQIGIHWLRTQSDSILVYTSGYASFADSLIPAGRMNITGILLRGRFGGISGGEHYALKMRDLNDVERCK